jgi:hypothetical protein
MLKNAKDHPIQQRDAISKNLDEMSEQNCKLPQ